MATVETILQKIQNWKLTGDDGAAAELERSNELSASDARFLQEWIKTYQYYDDEFQAIEKDLLTQPDQAVARFEALKDEKIKSRHLKYSGIKAAIDTYKAGLRRAAFLKIIEDAEELARDYQLWEEAAARITTAKQGYPELASGYDIKERLGQIEKDIQIDEQAQHLLNEVDRAIQTQKSGDGLAALNKLETLGKISRTTINDKRASLEKLEAHRQGRSSKDEREFSLEDVLDGITAAEATHQSIQNSAEYRNLYNQTRFLKSIYLKGIQIIRRRIDEDTQKIDEVQKARDAQEQADPQSPNLPRYNEQLQALRRSVAENDRKILQYEASIVKNDNDLTDIEVKAREQIERGINECLDLAKSYLESGAITQAEFQISAAEHWGDPEEQRPGGLEDYMGIVSPSQEQKDVINQLKGIIQDRRERRKDAMARMAKASLILTTQRPQLTDLKVAQQELNAALTIDAYTPGLEALRDDVVERIQSHKIGMRINCELQIDQLCQRGMFENAQALYVDLAAELGEDLDLSKLKQMIDETSARVDRSNTAQDRFEAILSLAQKNLEPPPDKINAALDDWKKESFPSDRRRIIQAEDRLEHYRKEIVSICQWVGQVEAALATQGDLPEDLGKVINEFSRTSQRDHPVVKELTARYWLEMATRHGQQGRALEYLQQGLGFAENLPDGTLAADLRMRIRTIQDQTEEGRRAQEIEENLADYLRNNDMEHALDTLKAMAPDDPLRKQTRIQKQIREIDYRSRQQQSETLYRSAMERSSDGHYAEALELAEKALSFLPSQKAFELKLKCETEQKIETGYLDRLQAGLDVNALQAVTLSTEQVKLLEETKTLADELFAKIQISNNLRVRARQYRDYYADWHKNVSNNLQNGRAKIASAIDKADFTGAKALFKELENQGLPYDLVSTMIEIKREIQVGETATKIVREKLDMAKGKALEGHFSRAIQQLQALDTDPSIPENLRTEVSYLLAQLEQSRKKYGSAYNLVFGASSKELQDLIGILTNQANRFSEKVADYSLDLKTALGTKEPNPSIGIEQTFSTANRDLEEIGIPKTNKTYQAVAQALEITRWWTKSVEATRRQVGSLNDYRKLADEMDRQVIAGTELASELIPELHVFADYMRTHLDVLGKFQANYLKMAGAAEKLITIGDHALPFSKIWQEQKANLRDILDNKHVAEDETKVDDLMNKINQKEKAQAVNFRAWAIPLGAILLIALVIYANSYYHNTFLPTYFPTPTSTLTPSVTPTVTLTSTITPTTTLTPIPTRTLTPSMTPTSTPMPLGSMVTFQNGIGIFELPKISGRIGTLNNGDEFNLLLYCRPDDMNKLEAWGLVRVPKTNNVGWIKLSEDDRGYDPVDLDPTSGRPVQMMLNLHPELKIECPGRYTPVPYKP